MDSRLTIVIGVLAALQFSLQIYALWSLWAKESAPRNQKIVWTMLIMIFGLLGPVLFFTIGRERLSQGPRDVTET
jgi:hypothetical protein